MKTRNPILLIALLITFIGYAQNGINYKAIIKDGGGTIVANQLIQIEFSILEGSTLIVYTEMHVPTTDANGLIIVNIGEGTPTFNTFNDINWGDADHFLNVQVNTGGGLQDMGTTQLKSVPYALSSADKVFEKDGVNAYKSSGNIGIGTVNPLSRFNISDASDASILLQTPSIGNISSLRLENGDLAGTHSFFKLENQNNLLRFAVDSDLVAGTGYSDIVTIATDGKITQGSIALASGATINEFSTDGTMADNSDTSVPTERAVKDYVDNSVSSFTEETLNLTFGPSQTLADTSFVTITSTSSNFTITGKGSYITAHVNVDGAISKYWTTTTNPTVVSNSGIIGTKYDITIFSEGANKMLFFEGMKFSSDNIKGILKVKDL